MRIIIFDGEKVSIPETIYQRVRYIAELKKISLCEAVIFLLQKAYKPS